MANTAIFFIFVSLGFVSNVQARSDLPASVVFGTKFPNSPEEGTEPVSTPGMVMPERAQLGGFNELLPFVSSSPNQEGAGSCLYMALTGAAEWWLRSLNPTADMLTDGPLDLSERFLMNQAEIDESSMPVTNWKTDSIYLFNQARGGVLNRDYRYTKGWFAENDDGYVLAHEGDEGAQYGTEFNWIHQLQSPSIVKLPSFERRVIFADPEDNQWNVGVAPKDIVDQVKTALKTNKAPILVVYNHYSYWHAVLIMGYDDEAATQGCRFTSGMKPHFAERLKKLLADAEAKPEAREELLKKAERLKKLIEKLSISTDQDPEGGCNTKGVFYVRDSIYSDPSEPLYDYDLSKQGEEEHLGYKVVLREYSWLKHLSNHVTQIQAL